MNAPYDAARYRMVTADFDWSSLNLVLSAWSGVPTFDPTHAVIDDILMLGTVTEIAYSLAIFNPTVAADGTVQTSPVVIPNAPVGPDITWFTMAEISGGHGTSKLLYFIDEAKFLPFTPNGADLVVTPDWLANRGWFRA